MKTIRSNCFETNSSSTHSITIRSVDYANTENPLCKDGVLIPANLVYSPNYDDDNSCYYSGYTLKARSKDEKAALLIHYIFKLDLDDDEYIDYDFFPDNALDYVVKTLKLKCSYTDICLNDFSYNFNGYSDDRSFIDDLFSSPDGWESRIDDYINDVILNDKVEVVDKYEDN